MALYRLASVSPRKTLGWRRWKLQWQMMALQSWHRGGTNLEGSSDQQVKPGSRKKKAPVRVRVSRDDVVSSEREEEPGAVDRTDEEQVVEAKLLSLISATQAHQLVAAEEEEAFHSSATDVGKQSDKACM